MKPRPLTRKPAVSVIIPCHNYAGFLRVAAESVLAQSDVDTELLIIDDFSEDESALVATELAERDPRVHARVHNQNQGHIATYNEGIEAATGEYVVILSADDVLTRGSLGRATALMEARPDVGLVYGAAVPFSGAHPMKHTKRKPRWSVWPGRDWIEARCRLGRNAIRSPEVVMRASVQREIGPYRPDLPRSGDFEMWMRAAVVSNVGHLDRVQQAFYRLHPDSMTSTIHSGLLFDLRARHDAFTTLLDAHALPEAERLYGVARKALAAIALSEAYRGRYGRLGDEAEALELIDFAREMFPSSTEHVHWHLLRLRRWLLSRWPNTSLALRALRELESKLHRLWLPAGMW